MKYIVINYAEDGRHTSLYDTLEAAAQRVDMGMPLIHMRWLRKEQIWVDRRAGE